MTAMPDVPLSSDKIHPRVTRRLRGATLFAGAVLAAWLATASAEAANLRLVPTYENGGVYVEGTDRTAAELKVFYRESGTASWQAAHRLSASVNDPTPRGSLFGLKPGTRYEVRCDDSDGVTLTTGEFTTWTDTPRIARTINIDELAPDGGPVVIREGGTPDGWVRYVADPGHVIDGAELAEAAITIDGASHVILDGLTIRGGVRHGILLKRATDIRIINCDIAGFGRVGEQDLARSGKYYLPGDTKAINWDAGVYVDLSGNVTVERCYVHDPRGRANSWFFSHPEGPNAIFVRSTGGMVIRYNDFVGSDGHRWNDVIEGYGNGKEDGGFNRDSDIYGNYLAFPNDDGIELDGGQRNVRCYGNKFEGGLCGISTAPNRVGPSYIFDNLVVNLGDERGGASAGVKNGGGPSYSQGETFFYHNTFMTLGRGVSAVGFGNDAGESRSWFHAHTLNNVFATQGPGIYDPEGFEDNTYDHDVLASPMGGPGTTDTRAGSESNGIKADAGFVDAAGGRLALTPGAPGATSAVRIPGFPQVKAAGVWSGGIGPMRPVAASLDRGQVMLTAEGSTSDTAQVRLRSSAPAGSAPVAFRILKNTACDWLKVSPSVGTLQPGGELTLSLTGDAANHVGRGLLHGAMLVKFDNGDSLPLTVYLVASPGHLRAVFEAESLPGADGFETIADQEASDGAAVRFVDQQAGRSGKGSLRLKLTFEAPVDGAYYVSYRVRTPRPFGLHDSIFVAINGEEPRLCSLIGNDDWTWLRLTGKTMEFRLRKGENLIEFIPREEIGLDAILVSDRPLMAGDAGGLLSTVSAAGHAPLTASP